jgi:hypothetical protein
LLKSTVWIHNPRSGWGTGVLINEEKKLVLTNFHVVARGTPNGEEILDFFWDKLSDGDALDNDAKPFKTYDFDFVRGKTYFIDLYSADFMGQLQVKDAGGRVLATEDLKASNQAARTLTFRSPADGSYQVVAKSADRRFGEFTLQVNVQIFQVKGKNKTVPQVPSAPAPLVYAHFPEFANGTVIAEKMHYVQQNKAAPDKFKADVVAYSEAKDLAVMRLSSLPQGIAPLPLSRESAKPGQAVHSIGNPGRSGALWVYTSGTVRTAPYHKKWQSGGAGEIMLHDALIIETQSPTNPGDSGGPLVNEAGELVAVTQGLSVGANSINLFIDVGDVRNFLQSYNLKWTE